MGNNEATVTLDKYKGFKMLWYNILTCVVMPIIAIACLLGAVSHILTLLNSVAMGGSLDGLLEILSKVKLVEPAVYSNYLSSYMGSDIIAAVLLALCGVLLILSTVNFRKLKKSSALFLAGILIVIPVTLFIYEASVVVASNGSVTFSIWSMVCLVAVILLVAFDSKYFKKRETVFVK